MWVMNESLSMNMRVVNTILGFGFTSLFFLFEN